MLLEVSKVPKDIALSKWYRVRTVDGVQQEGKYIQFLFAWDLDGNRLAKLSKGMAVITEAEYNGLGYP